MDNSQQAEANWLSLNCRQWKESPKNHLHPRARTIAKPAKRNKTNRYPTPSQGCLQPTLEAKS